MTPTQTAAVLDLVHNAMSGDAENTRTNALPPMGGPCCSEDDVADAVAAGYGDAFRDLEAATYGARMFLRGQMNVYGARDLPAQIRAVADRMEAALGAVQ
jgi:hypothetical protein